MPATTVQAPAQYIQGPAAAVQYAAPPPTTVVAQPVYAGAQMATRVVGAAGVLQVGIISARSLRDADWLPGGGKSDPYVQVEVRGKPHATFKTPVVNNTCDPVWNFSHDLREFGQG